MWFRRIITFEGSFFFYTRVHWSSAFLFFFFFFFGLWSSFASWSGVWAQTRSRSRLFWLRAVGQVTAHGWASSVFASCVAKICRQVLTSYFQLCWSGAPCGGQQNGLMSWCNWCDPPCLSQVGTFTSFSKKKCILSFWMESDEKDQFQQQRSKGVLVFP